MLLQNPNWLDSLNKAKKRVNKAAKANTHKYDPDLKQIIKKKTTRPEVLDVSKKLINSLVDLKSSIETAKLYQDDEDYKKYFSRLSNIETKIANTLLLVQYDVEKTYLFWSQKTFITVSEVFLRIIDLMSSVYTEIISRGEDPNTIFSSWSILYQTLGSFLKIYQNEGGKNPTDVPQVQQPIDVAPISATRAATRRTKASSTLSSIPTSQQAPPQRVTRSSTKIITQEELDKMLELIQNKQEELQTEETTKDELIGYITDIEDLKAVQKLQTSELKQLATYKKKLKETNEEIRDLETEIPILIEKYEVAAQKKADDDAAAVASAAAASVSTPTSGKKKKKLKGPKSARQSMGFTSGPHFGGTPGTPPTTVEIQSWHKKYADLEEEMRRLSFEISSITVGSKEYKSAVKLYNAKLSTLNDVQSDLISSGESVIAHTFVGKGRAHHSYDTKKAAHHAWSDVFYNINPPQFVKPYNVLIPISRIPKRYL
jgi:hypothetical protein